MEREEVKEELERTGVLISEHKRYLKKLEIKVAKFGLHTPPYMEVDIETTKEKLDLSVKRYNLMVDGYNGLIELDNKIQELKDDIDGYGTWIIKFADLEDHTQDAAGMQNLATEIAGLIIAIDHAGKEYVKLTKEYANML